VHRVSQYNVEKVAPYVENGCRGFPAARERADLPARVSRQPSKTTNTRGRLPSVTRQESENLLDGETLLDSKAPL